MTPQWDEDMRELLSWAVKYGLTGVMLCWILYIGVTQMVSDVHQSRIMMEQHMEANREANNRVELRMERMEAIQRQSCVNQATDRAQQQACWNAGYR